MTLRSSADPETPAAQPHRHVFDTEVYFYAAAVKGLDNVPVPFIFIGCSCGTLRKIDGFQEERLALACKQIGFDMQGWLKGRELAWQFRWKASA